MSSMTSIKIANAIIFYTNNSYVGVMLSGLKLHKITYYVACEYAKKYNKRLFAGDIAKWQYGATVLELFHTMKHRIGGYNHIKHTFNSIEFRGGKFESIAFDEKLIPDHVWIIIKRVVDSLIHHRVKDIVDSMRLEMSWGDYADAINGGNREMTYTLEELKCGMDINKVGNND